MLSGSVFRLLVATAAVAFIAAGSRQAVLGTERQDVARRVTASAFQLQQSPLLDLHMFLRSAAPSAPGADVFVTARATMRRVEQALGDRMLWGLVEPLIAASADSAALRAAVERMPEAQRLRDGRELRLREPMLAYAEALAAAEPAFREETWPEHQKLIERGEARLRGIFRGREAECVKHLVESLGMRNPNVQVPVYLVGSAPPPAAFTHRGLGGAVCIVGVAEGDDSLLAEMVLHELIHALDISTAEQPETALNALRTALREQGIAPTDPGYRDVPHTLMFVQAADTVSDLLDPEHVDYGEARSYYAKVPEAAAIVRPAWEAYRAGRISRAEAVRQIAGEATKEPATQPAQPRNRAPPEQVFIFPYFQSNGETGIFLALSQDGLSFEAVNDGRAILPAPRWRGNSLTRDPSILFHDGTFHMVWTTDWGSRSIGYAQSKNLVTWSEPRRIDLWRDADGVVNTWAPELQWDPQAQEFFILFSTTLQSELEDGDGSEEPANLDHRIYAVRTRDFEQFTPPALFYSPLNPEHSVIDAFVAPDDRGTADTADDRWAMVVKNELAPERGGKNLRLAFAEQAQGPYETTLSEPIAGQGSAIIDQMAEGPSLLKVDGLWHLYFDAPGSREPYSLATSPDLVTWTNRSDELRMPVEHPRHGTVARVPAEAVGWLKQPQAD